MRAYVKTLIACALLLWATAACVNDSETQPQLHDMPDVHETKAAHTEALMAIPGVVGVGVGETAGKPVIRVFVERRTDEVRERVPASLDGHPVEVVVTGAFKTGG